ncbi:MULTISPECIES: hypothetical protein [unclassified Pseudomonas]|uniref:hypothetical protein n=1 Tax=unclassified Pseudomonas TaxID=196821 RepID=UPI00128E92B2|nr:MULTISPECIES: hypothetical protein [unclassified Pseudomonas]MPQ70361.1 hypothetical protein [Pseudomonas sp. MWU12-2323]
MKKQLEAFVSPLTAFSIINYERGEVLSLSPSLYQRLLPAENYLVIDSWGAGVAGGRLSASTRVNEHGRRVSYNSAPFTLSIKGASTQCVFNISQHGGQVFYTSTTPHGTVYPRAVLYNDVIGGVALMVKEPAEIARKKNVKNPTKSHGRSYLSEDGCKTKGVASVTASSSIVIPDTEKFSFLTNANMYFSGTLYEVMDGVLVRVHDRIIDDAGSWGGWGGDCALTDDENNLYPDGISMLMIDDGFSEGKATIEFNHNPLDKTVTITVLSHTSKVCDLRDLTEVGEPFPYTICFAL